MTQSAGLEGKEAHAYVASGAQRTKGVALWPFLADIITKQTTDRQHIGQASKGKKA